ncbi:hypothetical protein M422DRAFT_239777 [Sphaerobolus stellatus SS14]|nr:hypothetical protein M422DRAFT_239777 [Sphaerobolus stellatus SS14]
MSETFESFETYWTSIIEDQSIAFQNNELPPQSGQYVPGWQEYLYENMGSIEHDANIHAPSFQISGNIDLDGNMAHTVAALISPTSILEEVTQEPLNTAGANHHAPCHSTHSYSRAKKEHRDHFALDHIRELSLGDRDGTHQCMYKRGRGICRCSFNSRDDAMRHIIEKHLKNIRFRCSCGRTFNKKAYAEKHKIEAEAARAN